MASWGPKLEFLYTTWKKTGVKPRALKNKPEVAPVNGKLMAYFNLLDGQRTCSESGPQPLKISEILAIDHLIPEYDTEETLVLITHCDRVKLNNIK